MKFHQHSCINHKLRIISSIALLIVLEYVGCAPSIYVKHDTFNSISINAIKKGMTTVEIEQIFGKPDIIFEATYGLDTEVPWEALVYKYLMGNDPYYGNMNRNLFNTFVFYRGKNPPILNNWEIGRTSE